MSASGTTWRWRTVAAAMMLVWGASAHAWQRVDAQLNAAASAGDLPAMARLIAEGASPDRAEALRAAISHGRVEAAHFLLEHHADPNAWARAGTDVDSRPQDSPVFAAAMLGDRALMQDLLQHGADLNAASTQPAYARVTPLMAAVRRGDVGAARLLIEMGADVNYRGAGGETALWDAIYYGGRSHALEMVDLLLAHGADPDIRDQNGRTARELSYTQGAPGIREAIERAKPPPPYTQPEAVEHIRMVLLCRAMYDAMIPGYRARTARAYARWRAPRAAAIAQIESSPEFKRTLADSVRMVTPPEASRRDAPDDLDNAGKARALCHVTLPNALDEPLPPTARSAGPDANGIFTPDAALLRAVLICKMTYDAVVPRYESRTARAYARWRAPRAAAIAQIEASPEFKRTVAAAIRAIAPAQAAARDPDGRESIDVVRAQCDPILSKALGTSPPPLPSGSPPGDALPFGVRRATATTKLAAPVIITPSSRPPAGREAEPK